VRGLLKAPGFAAPLAFGVLNGLLPCPLVYAFAAQAAASGGPLAGVQIMAAFGLGTFPAMLAMGGIGLWWRRAPVVHAIHATFLPPAARTLHTDWRVVGVRAAGCFIVLLGLVTLARGVLPMVAHLHG
jgi:sulfite exporter TauE/SafE